MNDHHPLLTEGSSPVPGTAETVRAPAPGSAPATAATALAAGDPLPIDVPAEIAGVRLSRQLGAGAMGEVYLGHHRTLDVAVAVKLLKPNAADTERFLQEARTAARIQHDHVVRVLNAGTEAGRLYLVMELVTGGDVAQLIKREGRLPWQRAVELMIQAGDGLGAAHRAGIVHRDVKPANFLLTAEGRLKVADLGMAKIQQSTDVELTQAGTVMGTPAYMAPEQAVDTRRAGPPADVYALGVSLFHLLCGRLPFQAETSNAMLLAHANQPVPDLRKLASDVPEPVVAVVRRMLEKDPAKRPADGDAAAAALRAVSGPGAVPAVFAGATTLDRNAATVIATPVRKTPLWFPVFAVSIVVVIAVGFWLAQTSDKQSLPSPTTAPANTPPAAAPVTTPVPTPTPAATKPTDRWQTPPRAAFVLVNGDPAVAGALESALVKERFLMIERALLDQVVAKELTLAQGALVDDATAAKVGRVVGGHLALLARTSEGKVSLRAVVIETAELAGSELVASEAAPATVVALAHQALALLPAQGRLEHDPDGSWRVSLGRKHGISIGDRFRLLAGDAAAPGAPLPAMAIVTEVEADSALVEVKGTPPTTLPVLARRVAK